MVTKADHIRVSIYLPIALRDRITEVQETMQRDTGLPHIALSNAASAVIQRGLDAMQEKRVPLAEKTLI